MARKDRSKEHRNVGKTEDQLGLPHARAIIDEAIAEVQAVREADRDLEIVKVIAKTVPVEIIRAYRKALRAQEELKACNKFPLIATLPTIRANEWMDGVKWELTQLYPELINLPEEK